MQRPLTIAIVACLTGAPFVCAEELPRQVRQDLRVREIEYDPSQVVLIATQRLYSTQVEFSTDETVITAGIGNPSFNMIAKLNYLFVKPTEMHPATNVNVVTQLPDGRRRTYQLVFGITPPGERREPPFFLVRFRYSADIQAKRAAEAAIKSGEHRAKEADRILARDEAAGPRNHGYSIQGDAAFEPIEVYDNGKVTTFRFTGATELPAIYLGLDDGREELVPKSVFGELVTVHANAKKFVMRRGNEVMCVFNEQYLPEGIEPGTKTTSPNVARVLKPQVASILSSKPAISAQAAQSKPLSK